jgi:phytoene dehydrogenase-like protein
MPGRANHREARRAIGVALDSGEEIYARVVASSLDPRRTFLGLLDENLLPEDFLADVRRYKFRGSSGKVNLALDGLPDFTALPGRGPSLRRDLDQSKC